MIDYFSRRLERAKYALIVLATLAPPVALALSAYDVAGTRYVQTHLVQTNPQSGEVGTGDIIAVTGRVTATPVRMAADAPHFQPALMVVKRFEVYHSGKHGGWTTSHTDVWISESATISGWYLTADLIRHAGFDWRRASPCSDYRPPAGWTAKCPGDEFAVDKTDGDQRLSYEITPLTNEDYTLIAAVADGAGSLGRIEHEASGDPAPGSILAQGVQDPKAVLAARTAQGYLAMAISWACLFLVAGCWMFVALGRNGSYAGLERFFGVVWRSAIIGAPFVIFCLGLRLDILVTADIIAATIGAAIGGLFWFRAIEG